jgi:hypothetical protein
MNVPVAAQSTVMNVAEVAFREKPVKLILQESVLNAVP